MNKVAVFCQIVESGNYRRASEVLNVTPSALSQTIGGLEHALGFALFDRVGKKLIPTANGKRLQNEFRHYHRGFLQALQDLAQSQDQLSGLIRIGSYLEFAKSQLTPALNTFLKTHPEVQAKLVFDTPSRLQQLLENGQVDLCFSIYPSLQTRATESRPVYQEELVLIAPPTLLPEEPSYQDILQQPVIEYYLNHQPIKRWLSLHFKNHRPKNLPVRAYAATAEMVLALVKSGLGIGVVPLYLLQSLDSTAHDLRIVRPTSRRFIDHIWLLEQKRTAKSPAHLAFQKHILQHFAERTR